MGILVGQRDLKFKGINISHMNRYYPNSLPFRWLREKLNIQKPLALQLGEWNDWEKNRLPEQARVLKRDKGNFDLKKGEKR